MLIWILNASHNGSDRKSDLPAMLDVRSLDMSPVAQVALTPTSIPTSPPTACSNVVDVNVRPASGPTVRIFALPDPPAPKPETNLPPAPADVAAGRIGSTSRLTTELIGVTVRSDASTASLRCRW